MLDASATKKAASDISDSLKKVGQEADRVGAQMGKSLSTGLRGIAVDPTMLQSVSNSVRVLNPQLAQVAAAANGAAAALGGGGGGRGAAGGGGGGGAGGGGLAGAAGGAAAGVNALTERLLRATIAFVTFRQALRIVEDVVRIRIEFDRLDFGLRAITGSWEGARKEADFFSAEVERLGLNFRETIRDFIKIQAAFTQSGFTAKEARDIFTDVSVVTKALGLSSATTGRILYDFQEMASLGVVQMRQLRMVLMQIPGGLEIAARAMGVTTSEFHRLIHEGLVPADEFILKFSRGMRDTFGGAIEEAAKNLESDVNRMKNSWAGFMAELGKSGTIRTGINLLQEVSETARITTELANSGKGKAQFLNERFPNARRGAGFFPEDFEKGAGFGAGAIDVVKTYKRMAAESQSIEQMQAAFADEAAKALHPAGERPATDKQLADLEKIELLNEKLHAESLEGLEKERALIDYNADKQIEALDKMLRMLDPVKDAGKIRGAFGGIEGGPFVAIGLINEARQREKNAIDIKRQEEASHRLTDEVHKEERARRDLLQYALGDSAAAQIEKINQEFRDQVNVLLELESVGAEGALTYDKLTAARNKLLSEVRDPRNRGGFSGESFGQLRAGVRAGEAGLLTETDRKKFDEITQSIQDRSAEMARRLRADSVSVTEAWQHGWEQQLKSYGSFSERVSSGAAQVADSLDRNFTDAFTGLITGTKSAGQAFSQMATSIVNDLVRIAVQQLLVRSILSGASALGSSFGGGGAGGGANATAYNVNLGGAAFVDHLGGVVGSGPVRRFHTGGVWGDEQMVIGRKGEVMFTPDQLSALGKAFADAGGSPRARDQKVTIYNGVDENAFAEKLLRDPEVIVNVIGRRKNAVRMVLGL